MRQRLTNLLKNIYKGENAMMKSVVRRLMVAVLTLSLVMALTGCGSNENKEPAPEEEAQVTETEEMKEKPEEVKKEIPVPVNREPYYLEVNCETNTVTVYSKDTDGEYTVPEYVMLCSSGLDSEDMPTPKGEYALTGNRWEWLEMIDGTYGIYVTQFLGDYLFHSVPYTEYGNHGSLKPGEYDKLGTDASHGCIRLCIRDAKWIYDNMYNIEGVNIIDSENPGPLGRPSLPKIDNSDHPGWDPTDAHPDNPWNL